MDDWKVYIVNLGSYNAGSPIGAWFSLPLNIDELIEKLQLHDGHVEYAIHDYEAPIAIDEYENLSHLNQMYEAYQSIEDPLIKKSVSALLSEWFDDVIDLADHQDDLLVYHGVQSMRDLAYDLIDSGALYGDLPAQILPYLDYEALGEAIEQSGNYLVLNGCVIEYVG